MINAEWGSTDESSTTSEDVGLPAGVGIAERPDISEVSDSEALRQLNERLTRAGIPWVSDSFVAPPVYLNETQSQPMVAPNEFFNEFSLINESQVILLNAPVNSPVSNEVVIPELMESRSSTPGSSTIVIEISLENNRRMPPVVERARLLEVVNYLWRHFSMIFRVFRNV